ncbi:hypothetical protein PF049_03650 [Erythrobacteraceae bacterium WH01K]|nr:hypothetical protein PF049_03650 [Erythrobacteraceae bacterium WH01K]
MIHRHKPPRFDARWQAKRRLSGWWRAVRLPLVLAAILAASWLLTRTATPGQDPQALPQRFVLCGQGGASACVIDGDTVALGPFDQRRRVRLTGFDAPEMNGACAGEREAAQRARAALLVWLNAERAYVDGGEQPPRDRYGRELRAASRADGSLLADVMIESGLAQGSGWGAASIDWCA